MPEERLNRIKCSKKEDSISSLSLPSLVLSSTLISFNLKYLHQMCDALLLLLLLLTIILNLSLLHPFFYSYLIFLYFPIPYSSTLFPYLSFLFFLPILLAYFSSTTTFSFSKFHQRSSCLTPKGVNQTREYLSPMKGRVQ